MPAIKSMLELSARSAANSTSSASTALDVVCAFPVSGQYGAGSRILYYVLVITCIFARKAEWLRGACLAAALVLPAVAALHGIVLASTHVNGAVDMDIFGVFQLCSIAILAAPLTVRLSRTYFYDPGRNIIFLWTVLILTGLIALCVEFYRVSPSDCRYDTAGNVVPRGKNFPYGSVNCSIPCSEYGGPYSPIRGGAASEIFVIPVPNRLTFNAAMLLATGFCIPAILSLVFTWDKILEINWKRRRQEQEENLNEAVEGANVTVGELKGINSVVRMFLSVIEIPLYGGAVIAILSIGEANFFSRQVSYQTEPMQAIGQWAPIAGTVLAALGSLYLLWYKAGTTSEEKVDSCTPSEHSQDAANSERYPSPTFSDINRPPGVGEGGHGLGIHTTPSNNLRPTSTIIQHPVELTTTDRSVQHDNEGAGTAGRPRVRHWFTTAANYLGNAAHQKLDVSDYKDREAHRYPEVPGEKLRNPDLEQIDIRYSQLKKQKSRAESTYATSIASASGLGGSSASPHPSPRPETSPSRISKRRDTLEVPTPVHFHHRTKSH